MKKETFTWQWKNNKDEERLKKKMDGMKRQVKVMRELKTVKTGRLLTDQI